MAADDLAGTNLRWGAQIAGLITNPYSWGQLAGLMDRHQYDAIRAVIEWGRRGHYASNATSELELPDDFPISCSRCPADQ